MKALIFLLTVQLIGSTPISKNANRISKRQTAEEVKLVTFDGAEGTTFKFYAQNDPVMGGVSTATFEVNEEENFGIFNGTVKIVPSLNAPGFCSMTSFGEEYNDASSAIEGGITLRVRTSSPDYEGFRMVFRGGILSSPLACGFGGTAPFTNFSDHWDPTTGNHLTECADDPKVCPTANALEKIKEITIMGEGVAGDFHLEILSISATN